MPNGGGDHSSLAARARTIERERDILARRLKGASTAAIALALGITQRTTQLALNRALTRVDIPGAVEAKKAMLARLDLLREKLFARFDAGSDDVATLARALVAVEQREAALLGLDVPQRLILAHLDQPNGNDEATVAKLRRLSPDELRTMYELQRKLNAPEVETTAQPTPNDQSKSVINFDPPAAPDFDPPADDRPTLGDHTAPPPPAIGETPTERAQRETARRPPSIYDSQIEHLETMLAMSDTEADRTKFTIQLRDLERRRDGR